jgi:hypothetical protein
MSMDGGIYKDPQGNIISEAEWTEQAALVALRLGGRKAQELGWPKPETKLEVLTYLFPSKNAYLAALVIDNRRWPETYNDMVMYPLHDVAVFDDVRYI